MSSNRDKQFVLRLSKARYSESVIRKTLYWMSEQSDWTLDEDEKNWLVRLYGDPQEAQDQLANFHKTLNDFCLRERHETATGELRRAVIRSALGRIMTDD